MIEINSTTVAVLNETELKNIISVNSEVNYIYFANDITLTTPITIEPSRTSLTLDGTYENITHTFTDIYSTDLGQTMGIRSASNLQMKMKNMNITGRNYYGIPYVVDIDGTKGVTTEYEKVVYTGRQITYNRRGTARYIDCNINIVSTYGTGEEVAEAAHVEIGGNTTITKPNADLRVFYFTGRTGNNSFKILTNANVTINTAGYFMLNLETAYPVPYTIESYATLKLHTNSGLSYNNDNRVSTFDVGTGATFEYDQNVVGAGAALSLNGPLTVDSGARFIMRTEYTTATPLIRFRSTNASNNLNIMDPKLFVVYKKTSPAFYFESTRPFNLSGGQINYWQSTPGTFESTGNFATPPLFQWHEKEWNNFYINGNVGTSATSGHTSDLPVPVTPGLNNLNLNSARILSVGDLPLTINLILDDMSPITGTTDPNAEILVEYKIGEVVYTLSGTADGSGNYSINKTEAIPAKTEVKVSSNTPYLYTSRTKTVIEAGELVIVSAPESIKFIPPSICPTPSKVVFARATNVPVVVRDTRVIASKWLLRAVIDGPMHCVPGYLMYDSIVFVPDHDDFDSMVPLTITTPVGVYEGGPTDPAKPTIDVIWDGDMGILLHVTTPLHLGLEYTCNIIWDVVPI